MDNQGSLRAEIYRNFDLQETEDLVAIWEEHDTSAYTEMAFETLREILLKRLGSLPLQEQGEPAMRPGFERAEFPGWGNYEKGGEEKIPTCPNCKSDRVFSGEMVELNSETRMVIKSRPPEENSDGEMGFAYNEIIAFACENCGHVFFILKKYN